MKPGRTKPTPPTAAAELGMLPPDTPNAQAIVPWLKLEPGTRLKATCLSATWLGAQTHWMEGRMKVHTSPTCRWCESGSPIRFYFFLHLASPNLGRQYIVQLSAGNTSVLVSARDQYGSLRGCSVELARRSKAANSPTTIAILGPPYESKDLPPQIDIRDKLGHAADWNTPPITDADKPRSASL